MFGESKSPLSLSVANSNEVSETSQPPESIPAITVNEVASEPEKKQQKRESKALVPKNEKKIPDQGVAIKGYIHRKKPGLGRNWEKTYCVLTYQAIYFTTVNDNKDYSNMLPIYPDSQGELIETKKGKGHDKHSQVPVSTPSNHNSIITQLG